MRRDRFLHPRLEPLEDRRVLAPLFLDGEIVGNLQNNSADEISGMVASRKSPGVLWLHNDSGDPNRIFALNDVGQNLGTFTISGVGHRDWEDIGIGPGPVPGESYLYISDTGNNFAHSGNPHPSVFIQRVPEPDIDPAGGNQSVSLGGVETIELVYPDQAHDTETLMVDPWTGDLFLITKRDQLNRVYRVPAPAAGDQSLTLEYMGDMAWGDLPNGQGTAGAVGGDVSPSGREIIVKNYGAVFYYDRPVGMTIDQALVGVAPELLPYIVEPKGEALTFNSDGTGYFTTSEGFSPSLYFYQRDFSEVVPDAVQLQNGHYPSTLYAGTEDVELDQNAAGTNFGSAVQMTVTSQDDTTGQASNLLLKWDLSAIPTGSTVQSVALSFEVLDSTTAGGFPLYAALPDWVEDEATWNESAADDPWQTPGASGAADRGTTVLGVLTPSATGRYTATLTGSGAALVQSWLDNPANNRGFVVGGIVNTDDLVVRSSESAAIAQRPKMILGLSPPDMIPPVASFQSPKDNSESDRNPLLGALLINRPFRFEIALNDREMNDASVTSSTVNITKDGLPFSDYTFFYDQFNDIIRLGTILPALEFLPGNYAITLSPAGNKIRDAAGNLMPQRTFSVVIDDRLPVFQELAPAGSLVYRSEAPGLVITGGDTQPYEIDLEAGQTLAVVVDADSPLRPTVSVRDPVGAVVGTDLVATAAGQTLLFPASMTTLAGTYTVTVGDTGPSAGFYRIQVTVGATIEQEQHGGAANNTAAAAQDLSPSAAQLGGGADRLAAVGRVDGDYSEAVLADNPITYWRLGETGTNTAANLGSIGEPANGEYEGSIAQGAPSLVPQSGDAAAQFFGDARVDFDPHAEINTFGPYAQSTVELWFRADQLVPRQFLYEVGGPNIGLSVYLEQDQLYVGGLSLGGAATNWGNTKFVNTTITTGTDYHVVLVHDAGSGTITGYLNGASFGQVSGVVQLSTHTGSGSIGRRRGGAVIHLGGLSGSGDYFNGVIDEVALYRTALSAAQVVNHYNTGIGERRADFYQFHLAAGQFVTLSATSENGGPMQLELYDSADPLAVPIVLSGPFSTNTGGVIRGFASPDSRDYYVRVLGETLTTYTLLVTRDAQFDAEPNNALAEAQSIAHTGHALGGLPPGDFLGDHYRVPVEVGDTLSIVTSTPGGDPLEPTNTLDPVVELYDPAGVLVSANDNGAGDGRNVMLTYPTAGGSAVAGDYVIRVRATGGTTGNYFLQVAGYTGQSDAFTVVSTTPAAGSQLPAGGQLLVDFNNDVLLSALAPSDLTVNGVPATSVTAVDSDTVIFNLTGSVRLGTNLVEIAAGAILDVLGTPVAAFAADFPKSLVGIGPAGSLIYEGQLTGAIGVAGEIDRFPIDLDAGQTASVVIVPAAGLKPRLELRDTDDDVIRQVSATAAGETLILPAVPLFADGEHSLRVIGLDDTTGGYSVRFILGAAVEAELPGSSTNNDSAAAENLDSAFVPFQLGGNASRAAVLGTTDHPEVLFSISEDFEAGVLSPQWTTVSTTGGRIELSDFPSTNGGTFALWMDEVRGINEYSLNEAIWTVDLDPASQSVLTFWSITTSDEDDWLPLDFTGSVEGDGVSISDDGVNWRNIVNAFELSQGFGGWAEISVDLATAAADAGMTLGPGFQIKFQQYDNFARTTDGRGFDDISVTVSERRYDVYGLSLDAGESASVALSPLDSNPVIADRPLAFWRFDDPSSFPGEPAVSETGIGDGTYEGFVQLFGTQPGLSGQSAYFSGFGDYVAIGDPPELQLVGEITLEAWVQVYDTNGLRNVISKGYNLNPDGEVVLRIGNGRYEIVSWNGVAGVNASLGIPSEDIFTGKWTHLVGSYDGFQWHLYRDGVLAASSAPTPMGPVPVAAPWAIGSIGAGTERYFSGVIDEVAIYDYPLSAERIAAHYEAGLSFLTPQLAPVEIIGGSGDVLAAATFGATNVSQLINDFVAPVAGTYYVRVDGSPELNYALVVTRGASLDAEPNDLPAPAAQDITRTGTVLGAIESSFEAGDYYRVAVNAGDVLVIRSTTPGGGPGEFVNDLDPAVQLYNPSGTLVAGDDNSASDGRNVALGHRATASGDYTIRIRSVNDLPGEYTLSVTGHSGASTPMVVARTDPEDNAQVLFVPASMTVDFSQPILSPSLVTADVLSVGGSPATGVVVVDGDTLRFTLPTLGLGTHQVAIAAGALTSIQGESLAAYNSQLSVDNQAPVIVASSITEGSLSPAGDLTVTFQFDEPINAANLDAGDMDLYGFLSGISFSPDTIDFDAGSLVLTLQYRDLPEDDYMLTLYSFDGAFEDLAGNDLDGEPFGFPTGDGFPGGYYFVNFMLDAVLVNSRPFERLDPLGGLILRSRNIGTNHTVDDDDSYQFFVPAGQTVSGWVISDDPTAQMEIELVGFAGTLTQPAGPGVRAILPTVQIATDQVVTVRVSGDTPGATYQLDIFRNATLERVDSSDGGELAIDGSLLDVGGGRFAALGIADVTYFPGVVPAVWGVRPATGEIVKLDPRGGAVLAAYPAPGSLLAGHTRIGLSIAEGGSSLLYVNADDDPAVLYRLNPGTGAVLSVETIDPLVYDGLAFGTIDGFEGVPPEVGVPSSDFVNLTDGEGFLWDIQFDGNINNGTNDAYDGGLRILTFSVQSGATTAEQNGREIVYTGTDFNTPNISIVRKIYVPDDQGFARFLEIVTNTGGTATSYTLGLRTNLGSDGGTRILQTSSGDAVFTTADDWIITDDSSDGNGGFDPTMLHVIAGPGDVRPSFVNAQQNNDNVSYDYPLTLAPGETKIIMHFAAQNADMATALAKAPTFSALGPEIWAGMTVLEALRVVNFHLIDSSVLLGQRSVDIQRQDEFSGPQTPNWATGAPLGALGGDTGDRAFGYFSDGMIHEFDPDVDTDSFLSTIPSPSPLVEGMAFDGALLYVSTSDGLLLTLDPNDGTVLYQTQLAGGALYGLGALNVGTPSALTQTLIPINSQWKYLDTGVDQGIAWIDPAFDDSPWQSGPGPLGFGQLGFNGNPLTINTFVDGGPPGDRHPTIYFRHSFEVTGTLFIESLTLNLLRDDGGAVYLNGAEVARDNLQPGAPFGMFADNFIPTGDEATYFPFFVDPGLLVEGTNVLTVEIHQANSNSTDLGMDLSLVASLRPFGTVEIDEYTVDLTGRAGHSVDVILDGVDGAAAPQRLEILDTDAVTVLASALRNPLGPAATNFQRAVFDFAVPHDGVYTLRVTTVTPGDYTVVVTDSLAFAAEPFVGSINDARSLNEHTRAIGHLGLFDFDVFRVDLTAGQHLALWTELVLDDPQASPLNGLVPLLGVFDQTFQEVASDSGSLDGRNALVEFIAAADGTYVIGTQSQQVEGDYILNLRMDGVDFGDAPAPYPTLAADNGARHATGSALMLGAAVDAEPDGQPAPQAGGDNDDGVSFLSPLMPGAQANLSVEASAAGLLSAWLDWNRDGDWDDANEQVLTDRPLVAGTNAVSFVVPGGASEGGSFARFRFSSTAGLSPTGFATDGEVEDYAVAIQNSSVAQILARHVFYNNSALDGNDPAAGTGDDAAIATDKAALLPGATATPANYTSFLGGVNGVILDVQNAGDAGGIGPDDFVFRTGNTADPATWMLAPAPASITVRGGEGVSGSDRVTIIWSEADAVRNAWLQVTVPSGGSVGLAQQDVFYFGSAVGDTGLGNLANVVLVDARDRAAVRDNPHNLTNPAAVDSAFDFNRDRLVNAVDRAIVQSNPAGAMTGLLLLTAPGGPVPLAAVAPPQFAGPPDDGPRVPVIGPMPHPDPEPVEGDPPRGMTLDVLDNLATAQVFDQAAETGSAGRPASRLSATTLTLRRAAGDDTAPLRRLQATAVDAALDDDLLDGASSGRLLRTRATISHRR